jgi:hypothetical protein
MKNQNMVVSYENLPAERMQREYEKYGRAPNPALASHPHFYAEHSMPEAYGLFDRPINEPNG